MTSRTLATWSRHLDYDRITAACTFFAPNSQLVGLCCLVRNPMDHRSVFGHSVPNNSTERKRLRRTVQNKTSLPCRARATLRSGENWYGFWHSVLWRCRTNLKFSTSSTHPSTKRRRECKEALKNQYFSRIPMLWAQGLWTALSRFGIYRKTPLTETKIEMEATDPKATPSLQNEVSVNAFTQYEKVWKSLYK